MVIQSLLKRVALYLIGGVLSGCAVFCSDQLNRKDEGGAVEYAIDCQDGPICVPDSHSEFSIRRKAKQEL